VDWQEALDGAASCADHSDHPTIFWAVERATQTGTQTPAAPVIRKASFGALSPFACATRYAPQGTTKTFTILFDNGGGITLIADEYCHHYDRADWAAEDVRRLLDGADPSNWDSNEPGFRREPHPEDDVMTDGLARKVRAGGLWPQRGDAWNDFCEALAGFTAALRIHAQERGAEYGRSERELADQDIAEGRRTTRLPWANGYYNGWLPQPDEVRMQYEEVLDAAARAEYEA